MGTDKPQIRKIYTIIEQTHSEGNLRSVRFIPSLSKPTRKERFNWINPPLKPQPQPSLTIPMPANTRKISACSMNGANRSAKC
jgi:hypothetical protein